MLTFIVSLLQVEDPSRNRQYYKQSISSEDYSFTAHADGKYVYCFSNEGWTSNSKEVSFNVHGIVYVPESELAQDPLETEGRITPGPTNRAHTTHYKHNGVSVFGATY
jgi:hypothetical protein